MTRTLQNKMRPLLYLAVALGVIASLIVGGERWQLEQANRATLLSLEWGQFKDVAARNGYTAEEALQYFRQADEENPLFSGVVYKEPTLYDWQNGGYLQIVTGAQLLNDMRAGDWQTAADFALDNNHNYILLYDEEMQQRVYQHLQYKTSAQNSLHEFRAGDTQLFAVETTYPYTDLIAFGIGFGEDDLELIKQYGLDLVVQVRSWPKVDEESLEFVFGGLKDLDIQAAGFNDPELPGVTQNDWADVAKQMAAVFKQHDLPTAYIEFYQQSGLETFARTMDYDMVRVHPVSESELLKLSDTRVQERFALAASERSMGVLMLRLRPSQSLDEAAAYVSAVRDAVQLKGVATDRMTVVPDMQVPEWSLSLVLLSVWAGGVLLLLRFDMKKAAWLLPAIALVAAAGLLALGKAYIVQKLIALAAVIIFPFLGVASVAREEGRTLPAAVLALCRMTLISLIGAVLVIGSLSEKSYMSAINTFSGVKIGQLAVLLLLMIYLLYRLASDHGGVKYLLVGFWRLMQKKVTIGLVLLGVLAAGLLLFYMIRTGNTTVGISDMERAFRAFLDKVLVVRPRTKEFMFAHPIMLAILYFGYRRQLWPCVLLGAIGQVSLVNTFEHLHTPIMISLLRTANGLALGLLIGVALVLVLKYLGGWLLDKTRAIAELAEAEQYD